MSADNCAAERAPDSAPDSAPEDAHGCPRLAVWLIGVRLIALLWAPYPSLAQSLPAPSLPAASATTAPSATTVIFVVRRGWHIDIGFDVADIAPPLDALATEFPGVRYLFFGFGDRRYLLANHRNPPVLLAALWPGPGMLLATGLMSSPQDAFGANQVIALTVGVSQARDAQDFIWKSVDQKSSYAPGPYAGSLYFTATQKYSGFHTCNTWAAELLAAAGLPVHQRGVVFASQLWAQVRRLEKKQSTNTRHMAVAQAAFP
jgi:hypothetical protein